MPFTPERDADAEGPVAWPGPQSPVEEFRNPLDHPVDPAEAVRNLKRKNSGEKHMTLKDFINIAISMAGAQIAWTLELGYVNPFTRPITCGETEPEKPSYGTPFLRELGLAEQLTSLVWLAGPISGLIAQPVIGRS
jgi:solute carrier family 45 protein 1/2/4